jgi:Pyruvate/2-oxoacid:ferredoxin oxidoreductase gamma subunit
VFQVRFHGRGGQGAVTAAEVLSVAAFVEGRHAQAFPSFGSEDAARTAKRLGATEAVVVYRRTRERMPAHDFEVEEAQ